MDDKENMDPCNVFWATIENETGSQIPQYIRNVLKYNGFNSAMSLKLLEEKDLDEIETIVQSKVFLGLIPSDGNKKEILGPFHDVMDKFIFPRGYRKVLLAISTYIREKGADRFCKAVKPPMFQESNQPLRRSMKGTDCSIFFLVRLPQTPHFSPCWRLFLANQ